MHEGQSDEMVKDSPYKYEPKKNRIYLYHKNELKAKHGNKQKRKSSYNDKGAIQIERI